MKATPIIKGFTINTAFFSFFSPQKTFVFAVMHQMWSQGIRRKCVYLKRKVLNCYYKFWISSPTKSLISHIHIIWLKKNFFLILTRGFFGGTAPSFLFGCIVKWKKSSEMHRKKRHYRHMSQALGTISYKHRYRRARTHLHSHALASTQTCTCYTGYIHLKKICIVTHCSIINIHQQVVRSASLLRSFGYHRVVLSHTSPARDCDL